MTFLVLLWNKQSPVCPSVFLKLLLYYSRRWGGEEQSKDRRSSGVPWSTWLGRLLRIGNASPRSRWCHFSSSGEWRHIPGNCCSHGLWIFTDGEKRPTGKQSSLRVSTRGWCWSSSLLANASLAPELMGCSTRVLCRAAWSSPRTTPLSPGPSEHLCLAYASGRAHPFPLGLHPVVWSYFEICMDN